MGCDIHMFIEYSEKPKKRKEKRWRAFGPGFIAGRNYEMFGILADGVRSYHPKAFEQKGLPNDLSEDVCQEVFYKISEGIGDKVINLHEAINWEKCCGSKIIYEKGIPSLVLDPNIHSHSWLTIKEFERALKIYEKNNMGMSPTEYKALFSIMETFKKDGYDVRAVFWFDS